MEGDRRVPIVILCGGLGTRLREETEYRPKPLVPIGDRPILWHIMKGYARFGFANFMLALGYKGEMIKDYFLNYELLASDFTLELASKRITRLTDLDEGNWRITFVDTGASTMTGGRLKRLEPWLRTEPLFMMTYGDGVSDIDIPALLAFHEQSGCAVTVTGVRPVTRYGELLIEGDRVARFAEKPVSDGWVSGGYFVMTPRVFDYLQDDQTHFEREPLERLAADRQLAIYRHDGYWACMDTYRDMQSLNELWVSGHAPWKLWREGGRATAFRAKLAS